MKILRIKNCLALFFVVVLLTSCSENGGRDGMLKKSDVGTLTGALAGAWVGSNTGKGKGKYAAIAAGTLLGAYLGNQVGQSLDKADMAYYDKTSQSALEGNKIGQTSTWRNPDTGNQGTLTPTKTFQQSGGAYCREYTQTVTVGGRTEQAYGTACRQPDGAWQVVQQ